MYAQKLSFDYAHTLHTVRIVHNAHIVHRSQVQNGQSCDCINFVRATDPACGSGNFLTKTYISLRRLENKIIDQLTRGQIVFGEMASLVKVSIHQFYGIEINDFACVVARTAMWIAELQMMQETQSIVEMNLDFLPLKTYVNIVEGNALRLDWHAVLPASECSYLMGNPPFVGARLMKAGSEQKADVATIFAGWKNAGNLDYVCCWYKKASEYMHNTKVKAALVSTNSVSQGESVATLWKPLFEAGIKINFAYRTFVWNSESNNKAHVHCVIIGFSYLGNDKESDNMPIIYTGEQAERVSHINAYLVEADDVFVESRNKPLCDVPQIGMGNQPIDDGNYLFTDEEKEKFIREEPQSKKYFKEWYAAYEFIHRKPRYCLWLGDCSPSELNNMPQCKSLIENVRQFRIKSSRKSTNKMSDYPTRFQTENMPQSNSILVPKTSSQNRKYIPLGVVTQNELCSDAVFLIPNGTMYHFGVLESNVHMAWMRVVAGRLKSDYCYSKDIVYNYFPWCTPTDAQRAKIEKTA